MRRYLFPAVLSLASAVTAQAAGKEFRTPSSNIECYFEAENDLLVCTRFKPTVQSVFLFKNEEPNVGPPETDRTAADTRLPVLDYGKTWRGGSVSCKSRKSALTCKNSRHGFTMSRASIKSH